MDRVLNKNKIKYIINHFIDSTRLDKSLESYFTYITDQSQIKNLSEKIIFTFSSKDLNLDEVKWINKIPILFPISNDNNFYTIENDCLIFHHDILKSAFYFLSGYQELNPEYTDIFNRFPYELSLQKKLGITKKPIVNYYFEIIKKGIIEFCEINSIKLNTPASDSSFNFFLTHDIDNIDTYNIYDLIYYLKVFFGITKTKLSIKLRFRKVREYFFNFFFTRKNLNWDFDFLRKIENDNNLKSAFYFLPKGIKHQDSYYSFKEPRLINLFKTLINDGCEIGIHGSVKSSTNKEVLYSNISELERYSNQKIKGIRQHRLMFNMKETPKIHDSTNLLYDTSLGFAEHEGFRNSFCHPFKLYNFDKDEPYSTWELPLNIMDATLFRYRDLSFEEAFDSSHDIINEIIKFNGILTLLWHNGNFDEIIYPGITDFYINLIKSIAAKSPKCFLGKDLNIFFNIEKVN